jgi:hypothetical protein
LEAAEVGAATVLAMDLLEGLELVSKVMGLELGEDQVKDELGSTM